MSLATRLSPELRARTLAEVLALLDLLQTEIHRLNARVAELEARLQQNSRNSSQPPSADSPADVAARPRRAPVGRKPGGQPSHAFYDRPLLPEDQVDAVVVKLQACRHCQAPLRGDDEWYLCHQVAELPPIRPTITEYQLHTLTCRAAVRIPRPNCLPACRRGPLGRACKPPSPSPVVCIT